MNQGKPGSQWERSNEMKRSGREVVATRRTWDKALEDAVRGAVDCKRRSRKCKHQVRALRNERTGLVVAWVVTREVTR